MKETQAKNEESTQKFEKLMQDNLNKDRLIAEITKSQS